MIDFMAFSDELVKIAAEGKLQKGALPPPGSSSLRALLTKDEGNLASLEHGSRFKSGRRAASGRVSGIKPLTPGHALRTHGGEPLHSWMRKQEPELANEFAAKLIRPAKAAPKVGPSQRLLKILGKVR